MKSAIFTDGTFGYAALEEAIERFSVVLKYDVAAVVVVDELRWKEINGIPVYSGSDLTDCLDKVISDLNISIILDITSSRFTEKFANAGIIVGKGLAVFGADYRIFPPKRTEINTPGILAVSGNRNFGKTATAAYINDTGKEPGSYACVAVDPRAPRYSVMVEPDRIGAGNGYPGLIADHKAGRAINLYHYAVALTAGIPACSATFAGIGLSGIPYATLDADGVLNAAAYDPDVIILLTGKSVVPRVSVDGTILIIDSRTDPAELEAYSFVYQLRIADIVIVLSPYGGGTRSKKLLTVIKESNRECKVFEGTEYPLLLSKPKVNTALLVYSERKEIVEAQRDYIEKTYSVKVKKIFDDRALPPGKLELKKFGKKGKYCFILDMFDGNFGVWLSALIDADIPVTILSRSLAPSPKKTFDSALINLLTNVYSRGQKRLERAKKDKEVENDKRDFRSDGNETPAPEKAGEPEAGAVLPDDD
ncbi:MAG: hypothetical protein GY771_16840 [bacterium]|nr:hypothetical protein [bacterium]